MPRLLLYHFQPVALLFSAAAFSCSAGALLRPDTFYTCLFAVIVSCPLEKYSFSPCSQTLILSAHYEPPLDRTFACRVLRAVPCGQEIILI